MKGRYNRPFIIADMKASYECLALINNLKLH